MKNLRRLLKSFPAKGSSQNVAEIKKEIKAEIESIKESQRAIRSEVQIPFLTQSVMSGGKTDENLLGDLLFYLRSAKMMSTLMLCRQIESLEVKGGVVQLCSEKTDLTELVNNEKHKSQLDSFFKSKGLSFKVKEKSKEVDPVEKLREFFGDKLFIK